jgi:hypothetical protein
MIASNSVGRAGFYLTIRSLGSAPGLMHASDLSHIAEVLPDALA